jgi:hypothetical protein
MNVNTITTDPDPGLGRDQLWPMATGQQAAWLTAPHPSLSAACASWVSPASSPSGLRPPYRWARSRGSSPRFWLVVVPLIVAFGAEELVPALSHPAARDFGEFLGSDAGHAVFGARGAGSRSSLRWSSSTRCSARSFCSAGSCSPG